MKNIIKCMFGIVLLGVVAVQAAPPTITKQVTPGTMSYQGRLQSTDGADYTNGIYTVDFKLYDEASGGTFLWGATYKPYVNNGFFTVILGQTSVGESAVPGATYSEVSEFWKGVWIDPDGASKQRFLGITVHEDANNQTLASYSESFPRQELQVAPFAIQAQFAQQASGDFSVPGHLTLTGSISNPNADLYITDTLRVDGDLVVNGNQKVTIGSLGTLAGKLPVGEPESSDLVVGNDLFVDDFLMVGRTITAPGISAPEDGASLQIESPGTGYIDMRAKTVCYDDLIVQPNHNFKMGDHTISHVVEAPVTGMRVVAGAVNAAGTEVTDIGNQFTVTRTGEGTYTVTFTPSFNSTPVVVISVANDSNSFDNIITLDNVYPNVFYVEARDDQHDSQATLQDTPFSFVVIGY